MQERVSHFTHELHAYLIAGAKMGLGMDKGAASRRQARAGRPLAEEDAMAINIGSGLKKPKRCRTSTSRPSWT